MNAKSTPSPPRARPIVTPSRPSTLAAGQAPVADAASSPAASGRVRRGYRASAAGSSVPSRPKTKIGQSSQPIAKMLKMTVVRSTDALSARNWARSQKVAIATSRANVVLVRNETRAAVDERIAFPSMRSFSSTRSRAMTVPPHPLSWGRPGR